MNAPAPMAITVAIALSWILMLFGPARGARAEDLNGRIVAVLDGDTVTLRTDANLKVRIRLTEIDAPETDQPWGAEAKQVLTDLVFHKEVLVLNRGLDPDGRTLGRLYLGGTDVNAQMVRSGAAWAYRRHLSDPSFLALEQSARDARRGLWSLPASEAVPPWEWRAAKSGKPAHAPRSTKAAPPDVLLTSRPAGADAGWRCGAKRSCGRMTSCAEAQFYLRQCGVASLDADRDGVPCEELCP